MKSVFVILVAGMASGVTVRPVAAAEAAKFKETVLWSFGSGTDGIGPSGLIDVKGTFYGTTGAGGLYGSGTVFSLDPGTGSEKVLYSFCSQTNCTDGAGPSGLIDVKGTLYGTTGVGGTNINSNCEFGCGTVFSLDPNTGVEKVLYSFCSQQNCTDGRGPGAALINVKGTLYGTTADGGSGGAGTAYALDPATGAETVLYSFCSNPYCQDGGFPASALIAAKGSLYGTTTIGGATGGSGCGDLGCGTVYSLDPNGGDETVLHSFGYGTDGTDPLANLIEMNGVLYGTTEYGGNSGFCNGTYDCGTVYSLDPKTGAETVLHSFQGGTDGANPYAGLINVKGTLYGTTAYGGRATCQTIDGCGTVFSLDAKTGEENVLYSFCGQQNCTDGSTPLDSLIDVNGTLYGTTALGGAYCDYLGCGTVFALKKKG